MPLAQNGRASIELVQLRHLVPRGALGVFPSSSLLHFYKPALAVWILRRPLTMRLRPFGTET